MNAQTTFPRFNALAAYEAEREENRRLDSLLDHSIFMMEGMVRRLERYGEDVSTYRLHIAKAKQQRFEGVAA